VSDNSNIFEEPDAEIAHLDQVKKLLTDSSALTVAGKSSLTGPDKRRILERRTKLYTLVSQRTNVGF